MVRNIGILKKAMVCSHPSEGTPSTLREREVEVGYDDMTKQMFYISMVRVCVEERVGVVERGGRRGTIYQKVSCINSPILE